MKLSFNTNGNLHKTVELTLAEFEHHFGTTALRKEKIKNAFLFFEIFSSCGCTAVYIGGSFVSTKKNPEDIDICFDLRQINYEKLEKAFPDFFDHYKIGEIRRNLKCHILYFDDTTPQFFNMLQEDRDGHPKGLVKIDLKDSGYD
jgi:hypothetical protein